MIRSVKAAPCVVGVEINFSTLFLPKFYHIRNLVSIQYELEIVVIALCIMHKRIKYLFGFLFKV